MKVADVKLKWTKSPNADIKKVKMTLTIDGTDQTIDLGPEVEDYLLEVKAGGAVQFSLLVFDEDGLQAMSVSHTFTLGDLETPQPPTDLGHEIVAIRDVEE